MKLGISYFPEHKTADEWAAFLENLGCTAAVCPIDGDADDETIAAYRRAADEHGITIAEVGVWNSPISDDPQVRADSLTFAKKQLRLADKIGANCCVNVAGSTGAKWYLGCKKDRTPEGYQRIVESIQEIIDDVQPQNTYYTIECMPIVPPTSPEEYLQLMKDVNRPQFSVHMDAFNMLFTPDRYFWNDEFFRTCFRLLGPQVKSIHAKDVTLADDLTFFIKEAKIGEGNVDYDVFLTEINKLSPDMPVIIEHRDTLEEYIEELAYVRAKAEALGIEIR